VKYLYHFLLLFMAIILMAIFAYHARAVYSYSGADIAMAILHDPSTLISS